MYDTVTEKKNEENENDDGPRTQAVLDHSFSRCNHSSNVVIGCDCCSHHPIETEVQEGEEHEEDVPKELCHSPIKPNHGINYDPIYDRLDKNVRDLNHSLKDRTKMAAFVAAVREENRR